MYPEEVRSWFHSQSKAAQTAFVNDAIRREGKGSSIHSMTQPKRKPLVESFVSDMGGGKHPNTIRINSMTQPKRNPLARGSQSRHPPEARHWLRALCPTWGGVGNLIRRGKLVDGVMAKYTQTQASTRSNTKQNAWHGRAYILEEAIVRMGNSESRLASALKRGAVKRLFRGSQTRVKPTPQKPR